MESLAQSIGPNLAGKTDRRAEQGSEECAVCPAAADCLADEGGRGLAVVEQVVAGSDGRDAQVPVDVADDA
jgi:hypothetical protein